MQMFSDPLLVDFRLRSIQAAQLLLLVSEIDASRTDISLC